MRKTFLLRLTRIFVAMAAVVGIALHPTSKLVDGVSGATRQKSRASASDESSTTSDNSIKTSDNSIETSDNSSTTSDNIIRTSNDSSPTSNNSTITSNNSNPTIAIGWVKEGTNWTYIKKDGYKATDWLNDGSKWYYFSSNGEMLTGSSGGIGVKLLYALYSGTKDVFWASVITSACMGIFSYFIVIFFEKICMPWRKQIA